MSQEQPPQKDSRRLVAVTLDENSIGRSSRDVEHERAVAIYDLLEENTFFPNDSDQGPFALHLSITGSRLMFDIRLPDGTPVIAHLLSLSPLRRIVKDYYTVCDSYYDAIRTATPDRIEALDMGRRAPSRRGLPHPDGAAQAQSHRGFRYGAASVHADLRVALEGMTRGIASRPQAVLFACGLNAVRSPMAAALLKQMLGGLIYVGSVGVRKGELDPFAAAVMDEIGIDIHAHAPITFEELEDLEGLNFDLIITLSPEAHHKAIELTRTLAADVEYWPTADPTAVEGSRAAAPRCLSRGSRSARAEDPGALRRSRGGK